MNTPRMHALLDSLAAALVDVIKGENLDAKHSAEAVLEDYRAWKIVYKARGPKKSKVV